MEPSLARSSVSRAPTIPVEDMTREQLIEELANVKSKFVDWKARAQRGVEQLREQLAASDAKLRAEQTAHADCKQQLEAALSAQASPSQEPQPSAVDDAATPTAAAAPNSGDRADDDEVNMARAAEAAALEAAVEDLRRQLDQQQVQQDLVDRALSTKLIVMRSATLDALRVAAAAASNAQIALQQHGVRIEAAKDAQLEALQASLKATTVDLVRTQEELAQARREAESTKAEFDRYRERSAKALRLTTSGHNDMEKQVEAARQAEARAQAAMAEAHATVAAKDRMVRLIEERSEGAVRQLAVANRRIEDLEEALEDMRRARDAAADRERDGRAGGISVHSPGGGTGHRSLDGGEDSDADLAARGDRAVAEAVARAREEADQRLREEIDAAAAAFHDQLQSKEAELVHLRVRLAQTLAKRGDSASSSSSPDGDAYVRALQQQINAANNATEELRLERDQLKSQLRRLHTQLEAKSRTATTPWQLQPLQERGPGDQHNASSARSVLDASSSAYQALAGLSADDLRRQLLLKSEQLFDANQQVVQLRATLRASATAGGERSGTGARGAPVEGQQASYLRAILLSFFTAKREEVRAGLIPVLATLLHLTTDELRSVYGANPDWIS